MIEFDFFYRLTSFILQIDFNVDYVWYKNLIWYLRDTSINIHV